jgi:transglutaminase-like putative cysteine protease
MIYDLVHRTVYVYTQPVSVSHHAARLHPRVQDAQGCASFDLRIVPEPAVSSARDDYFGNAVNFFTVQQPHRRLEITARSRVSTNPTARPDLERGPLWDEVAALFEESPPPDLLEPHQFTFGSPMVRRGREFAGYAAASFPAGRPLLKAVADLNGRIHRDFKFDPRATTVTTPVEDVMRLRRGVCQDFAHLMIACLRSLALPARYVSGYLRTRPKAGSPRLVGADMSHAWVAVFCPAVGWVDFDPTNNLIPDVEHVSVAVGRDYSDVAPVAGIVIGGGRHAINVSVDLRVAE